MAEPLRGVERELEESVRRVLGALHRLPGARLAEVAEKVSQAAGTVELASDRLEEKSLSRTERRLLRRFRRDEEASVPRAFVLGAAAVAAAFVGITQPQLFWLLFVALGFGMGAARTLARAREKERQRAEEAREERMESRRSGASTPAALTIAAALQPVPLLAPPPPAEPESPILAVITARENRVDGICDRLLAELKKAPPIVSELLRKPEETVEALRGASKELARRERDLRGLLTEVEGERLLRERSELATRAEAAPDAVVKSRLASALEALDAQLANRAELSTAAARIEAEGTRILYSLESLRAQVLRAFAADAAAAEVTRESLKGGLETLSAEIDAVATALEEVHGVGSAASTTSPSSGPSAAARAAARQASTI
jgi:DNA repair exonuclease SbcCD ATPase subunit